MRLDPSEHSDFPWRINTIAADFELVDAWALPARGRREEFADLCDMFSNLDSGADKRSSVSRALFTVRLKIGDVLGWDDEANTLPIPGCDETSLRDRLPPDLEAATDTTAGRLPFRPVYRTDDEWALELSNSTVHSVLHLGWAPQPDGTYRGQLGVYVKNRGRLGRPYMVAIAPFRHYIVYPALLRRIERAWTARTPRHAVVAVIHDDGRFLWIKRGPDVPRPGYWMPPSGSIEPGESAAEAVVREMAEELDIEVRPIREVWQCPTEDAGYTLEWWLTEIVSGEAKAANAEVADLRWVTRDEIGELSPTFAAHLRFIDDVWPRVATHD